MNKETKNLQDEALADALSPIINSLIDKNYENSKDKIASQMAPLMGVAIREQIKSQKDDIIDALYPVMGNMISKYISKSLEEMLNSINQQIQSGLSFETLKRKIRAKSKGISETQLLLEENSHSNIKALLLIHKETGIVLAEAHDPNSPIAEPEMVASMMTAIRSFVNDWVEKNEEYSEIGEIEYGGSKIVIESSGHCYLAVIIDGAAYSKTYNKIRTALENIVSQNSEEIREFDGDLSKFPNMTIYKEISTLLEKETVADKKKKKLHPLIFLIPILFFTFLGWSWYNSALEQSINDNINRSIYKMPQLTSYRISSSFENEIAILNGEVPSSYHKNLAQTLAQSVDGVKKVENRLIIVSKEDDPQMISSNIAYLLKGLNTHKGINITYKYNYPTLELIGLTWDRARKEIVLKEIQDSVKSKNIIDHIEVVVPSLQSKVYFKKASSTVTDDRELLELVTTLNELDNSVVVVVKGYSDSSGTDISRKNIATSRAQNVATLLKEKFFVTQEFQVSGEAKFPQTTSSLKNPKEARCSIVSIQSKED